MSEFRNVRSDVVLDRGNIVPLGTYADGTTRLAWPNFLYEPAAAFSNILSGQTPVVGPDGRSSPEAIQAALSVAGLMGVGSVAGSKIGANSAKTLYRNDAGFDAPNKPPRSFHDDYPRGVEGAPGSRLAHDIEGRHLGAEFVAGRRTVGGNDEGLGPEQLAAVANMLFNVSRVGPGDLPRTAAGSYKSGRIKLADDLSPSDQRRTLAHEMGHGIDER